MSYAGQRALVTGASSGIGEAFARALAARGMDALITALPGDGPRLESIAAELRERYSVRIEVVPIDLAERGAAFRLQASADELGFDPDLLVNSAGLGAGGLFGDASLARHLAMVHVNVEALVALTGLYVPRMAARRHGAIINVASTAAFDPMPYLAVYAASKSFVLRFSEALWAENHTRGVRVVALCPGPVATAFHAAAGDTDAGSAAYRRLKRRYLTPGSVVESALDALDHDRPVVVRRLPGARAVYLLTTAVGRVLPHRTRLLSSERLSRWYFEPL